MKKTRNDLKPPKILEFFFRFMFPDDEFYTTISDIEEDYRSIAETKSRMIANFWYGFQILLAFPQYFIHEIHWDIIMIRNYLKVTFRNMRKYKGYSSINIIGLAIGLACSFLITLYIVTEIQYDRYHENANRIVRLTANLTLGTTPNLIATTNSNASVTLKSEYPEVVEAIRLRQMGKTPVKYDDIEFYEERMYYADASIFSVFTFPMLKGSPAEALKQAYTAVITEETAKKYFGETNPIGKMLKLNAQDDFTITGVIENVPVNSHFVFDILFSFETLITQNPEQMAAFAGPFSYFAYLLLEEGADYRELQNKLPDFADKYANPIYNAGGANVDYFLQPLTEIHLHPYEKHEIAPNSDIMYVYIFSAIALFIIFIACINFMNLSTARSARRSMEIGIRKVLGSDRKKIIKQFYFESIFYSVIALVIALITVRIALPHFSFLAGRDFISVYSENLWLIPGFILLALAVGFISGSYPAVYLSGFLPVNLIRGVFRAGTGNNTFRKILVVFQFVMSITLIVGTGIVFSQLNYLKNMNLGFDREQVLVVPVMDRSIVESIESIKEELKSHSGILNVAIGSHVPGNRSSGTMAVAEGFEEGQTMMVNFMNIDADYFPALDMKMVQGRNFSTDYPTDPENSVILNEAAAREIGWTDAVGKKIRMSYMENDQTVIGVVGDFHYKSAHRLIEPLYITNNSGRLRNICIRLKTEDISGTIAFVEDKWKEFDSARSVDYYFLDEYFDGKYRAEQKLSRIFTYFTVFAIFIACLGLFGLASFTSEQRTKEIGIRKVYGASISKIVLLLTKEFMKWVLYANLIAWPLGYFGMNRWLQNFAYRTDIGIEIFVYSGIAAFIIAFVTVSYQTVRTALANPVDSIRYE